MNLGRVLEAVGLGAARDARLLVARLPQAGMTVATRDEAIVRALQRGKHQHAATLEADAALALVVPEGEEGLLFIEQLMTTTRAGGIVGVAHAERERIAGLFLRAGLEQLRQDNEGGTILTTGRVRVAQ
jgi:hypothetical protein